MDETTKQDLARRAVACPWWRWMPGMRATWPDDGRPARRYGSPGETAGWVSDYSGKERIGWTDADALPDLDDAATLGWLLALVREVWRCDEYRRLTIEPAGAGWCIIVRNGRHRPPSRARPSWDLDKTAHPLRGIPPPFGDNDFATEAEALVTALEAAGGGS